MKGRKEEAEVIIRLDQLDGLAHICVHAWPAMYRKMLRLHGKSKDGDHPEWSARWQVPLKLITIRRGIAKLPQLTASQSNKGHFKKRSA